MAETFEALVSKIQKSKNESETYGYLAGLLQLAGYAQHEVHQQKTYFVGNKILKPDLTIEQEGLLLAVIEGKKLLKESDYAHKREYASLGVPSLIFYDVEKIVVIRTKGGSHLKTAVLFWEDMQDVQILRDLIEQHCEVDLSFFKDIPVGSVPLKDHVTTRIEEVRQEIITLLSEWQDSIPAWKDDLIEQYALLKSKNALPWSFEEFMREAPSISRYRRGLRDDLHRIKGQRSLIEANFDPEESAEALLVALLTPCALEASHQGSIALRFGALHSDILTIVQWARGLEPLLLEIRSGWHRTLTVRLFHVVGRILQLNWADAQPSDWWPSDARLVIERLDSFFDVKTFLVRQQRMYANSQSMYALDYVFERCLAEAKNQGLLGQEEEDCLVVLGDIMERLVSEVYAQHYKEINLLRLQAIAAQYCPRIPTQKLVSCIRDRSSISTYTTERESLHCVSWDLSVEEEDYYDIVVLIPPDVRIQDSDFRDADTEGMANKGVSYLDRLKHWVKEDGAFVVLAPVSALSAKSASNFRETWVNQITRVERLSSDRALIIRDPSAIKPCCDVVWHGRRKVIHQEVERSAMWLALPLNPQLTQRLTGLHHTGSNIRLGSRIAFEAGRQLTAQAKLQAERKNKQQLPRKAELLPVISPKSQRPPFRTEIEPLFYIDLIDDKPKISAYALREGELCILPSSEHWGRTPHGEPLPLSSGQVYVIGRTRRQVVVTPHPECLWGNDGLLIWTSEPAPLEIYSLSRWFHVLVRAYAPISKDHHQPTYNAAAYTRPPFPRQLAEKLQPLRERLVEILKVPDLYMRIGNFSAYVLYDNHPLFVEPNKPIIREGSILRQEEGFKIEVTDPNLLEILTYSVRCIQKKTHIRDLLMVPHEDWSWAAELLRKYDQREEALSRFQNDLDDLVGESLGLSGHTSDICQFYEYFNDQNPCHPSTLESCPVRRRGESTEDASLKLRALHRDEPPLLGAAGLRDSDLV